jgi:hypothetical protein
MFSNICDQVKILNKLIKMSSESKRSTKIFKKFMRRICCAECPNESIKTLKISVKESSKLSSKPFPQQYVENKDNKHSGLKRDLKVISSIADLSEIITRFPNT